MATRFFRLARAPIVRALGALSLLVGLTACVGPQPVAWWLSRHGGFHFVFQADPPGTGNGLNAEQKAGAFALLARGLREPRVLRLELLASTRYPPGMIYEGVRRYGVADLAGRLSGQGGVDAVQPAEVADWLANRGLYLGGRFPHEHAPRQQHLPLQHRRRRHLRRRGQLLPRSDR